jgi:hypothetical protein
MQRDHRSHAPLFSACSIEMVRSVTHQCSPLPTVILKHAHIWGLCRDCQNNPSSSDDSGTREEAASSTLRRWESEIDGSQALIPFE